MNIRSALRQVLRPVYRNSSWIKESLRKFDRNMDLWRHQAYGHFPALIRADPRSMFISLTSFCNLRCKGCSYGRDFMAGTQLPWDVLEDLIDDAKTLRFERIRLYGGEPLLHKDLARVVERIAQRGIGMWLTTNGILLREKIDELYRAGLRKVSLGFYGVGEHYNEYVQRSDRFRRMEEGVAYVHSKYGKNLPMDMDWLLMRPTSNLESVRATWDFAQRYSMPIYVNLIHYSLPYFTEGDERELQFQPEDRECVEAVAAEFLEYKQARPDLIKNSEQGLRSIPDWLIKGPGMRVPCTQYRLIWVGPDGTVQLCYVTFRLGSLHEKRLKEMLLTPEHHQASRDAFAVNCPNCHCGYDQRVLRHRPSYEQYSRPHATS